MWSPQKGVPRNKHILILERNAKWRLSAVGISALPHQGNRSA